MESAVQRAEGFFPQSRIPSLPPFSALKHPRLRAVWVNPPKQSGSGCALFANVTEPLWRTNVPNEEELQLACSAPWTSNPSIVGEK